MDRESERAHAMKERDGRMRKEQERGSAAVVIVANAVLAGLTVVFVRVTSWHASQRRASLWHDGC